MGDEAGFAVTEQKFQFEPIDTGMSMDDIPQVVVADGTDASAIARAAAGLAEHGVCVVHRGAAFVDGVKGPFREIVAATPVQKTAEGDFFPRNTKRFTGLVSRIPEAVVPYCVDPVHMALCDATIGLHGEHYRVHAGPSGLVVGPV